MFVHKSSCHQHNQAAIVCDVGVEHRWTLHLIPAFSVASVALMDTNTRVVLIYFDTISVILVMVYHAIVFMHKILSKCELNINYGQFKQIQSCIKTIF